MKNCDNCQPHSKEWSLSAELARSNRRMFVLLLVVIFMWMATIGAFIWYINQFDYAVEGDYIEAEQDGTGVNIVGNGDVNYGTESANQESQSNTDAP